LLFIVAPRNARRASLVAGETRRRTLNNSVWDYANRIGIRGKKEGEKKKKLIIRIPGAED